MGRKQEQADLIRKLGALMGPLDELTDNPERFDAQSRARAYAKFHGSKEKFSDQCQSFFAGEPGHFYQKQYQVMREKILNISSCLDAESHDLRQLLDLYVTKIQEAILEVPVEGVSDIVEANSPFTACCLLKDICSTALGKLVWVDRYFDSSLFTMYLRDVRPAAEITLVTWPDAKLRSKPDKDRFSDFIQTSKLFGAERGPSRYRLIVNEQVHDRWLQCDSQWYTLGDSAKNAAVHSYFSVGKIESTLANSQMLDDLISNGKELFGSTNTSHT